MRRRHQTSRDQPRPGVPQPCRFTPYTYAAGADVEFERRYDNIVKEGWRANPRREGRAQRSRAGNLIRRLDERRAEVLRFLHDFRVPFTNNEIERDLRMVKLHEKVSGGWRSEKGARAFLRVRSYLATARKQGKGMLEVLTQAFEGRLWMPASSGL